METSPAALVAKLRAAADAYYNGGDQILGDDAYDALLDTLRSIDPTNPYLDAVGAPVADAVPLPTPMPSLDKIKPGMLQLDRFLARPGAFVISEKLDGLSALWSPKGRALYLRGDGRMGQSISHLAKLGLQGLVGAPYHAWLVRGELIMSRSVSTTRSIVNGIVHRDQPDPDDVAKIRFVAYEVIQPANMTRSEQFEWLTKQGFLTPWWTRRETVTEADLRALFTERRAASMYDTDGLVVGIDCNPDPRICAVAGPVKPPKDCVAFKMPLADQSAVTTVQEVLWAPSAQGYLIPRLRFDPIQVGAATITFCTGHNAKTIVDQRIGPGAQVRIRRSGDVIPTLDTVLVPAAAASLPPESTWEWDANSTHIRATTETAEQGAARLLHFAKTVRIPAMGPAACRSLYDAGVRTPSQLWSKSADELGAIVGPKTGLALYANLRTFLSPTTPDLSDTLLALASSLLPRGVGESKLRALAAVNPDPRTWVSFGAAPAGWTAETLRDFAAVWPAVELWRTKEFPWLPYPLAAPTAGPAAAKRETICFTGFRDAELKAAAIAAGFTVADSLTSAVKILVTAGAKDGPPSAKEAKAAAAGIEVLTRADFAQKYLGRM